MSVGLAIFKLTQKYSALNCSSTWPDLVQLSVGLIYIGTVTPVTHLSARQYGRQTHNIYEKRVNAVNIKTKDRWILRKQTIFTTFIVRAATYRMRFDFVS